MFAMKAYGGPADGRWFHVKRGQSLRVAQLPTLDWLSANDEDTIARRDFVYDPVWMTSPGWRMYFPVLVPCHWHIYGIPAGTVMPGHIEGKTLEHWPIEEGARLR